jgi:RNA polymerase subunit RPABC4/transcription elongation factor Spt4
MSEFPTPCFEKRCGRCGGLVTSQYCVCPICGVVL